MKKLLVILVSVMALNVNAQLVVKEAPKDTVIWQESKLSTLPQIIRFTTTGVHSYTIYYKNAKYTSITDINYLSIGDLETTRQFFQLCKSVVTEDKEYSITLGKKDVSLKKSSLSSVLVWTDGSYFYLSGKHLDSILEKL
jgi:sensor histidine kinase regulating citrate/malate metabolism